MIEIIDNYNKLPLGKYVEIQNIINDKGLEEIDIQVKIISVLTDLPEEEILHLPIGDYNLLARQTNFLKDTDHNQHRVAKTYHLGKFKLKPLNDFRKMETCQYVDFQTFAPKQEQMLVEILSVFLVPEGKRYNEDYDILEVQQAIRENMTVTEAFSLIAFFLRSYKKLMLDSLNSCKAIARMLPKTERTVMLERIKTAQTLLRRNGAGLQI